MKLSISTSKTKSENRIFHPSMRPEITANAAETFHKHLLYELEATDLPHHLKQAIANSISIETRPDGEVKLHIGSTQAGDLEFGTSRTAEQPWIRRALDKTRTELGAPTNSQRPAKSSAARQGLRQGKL